MKIFKIILILVLLFSISCYGTELMVSYDQPLSQGEISDWQKSYGQIGKTKSNITWIEEVPEEPDTLLEWFKDLTLDEKIKIYNWWKDKEDDH